MTLNEYFDAICGYTKQELEDNFKCYSWGNTKVYNPFSIGCLLKNRKIRNYWFASGAPRFLIQILFKNFNYRLHKDKAFATTLALGFGSTNINTTALMFQTGYLTITDYDDRSRIYTLDYPNREVDESLQMFMCGLYYTLQNRSSLCDLFAEAVPSALPKTRLHILKKCVSSLFSSYFPLLLLHSPAIRAPIFAPTTLVTRPMADRA